MKKIMLISLLASQLLFQGCATKNKSATDLEPTQSGIADATHFYGRPISLDEEKSLLAQRTFHFDFDRYEVREDDLMALYAHAKYLTQHRHAHMRIEGHTDDRGSREYNVALGESRAKAVANVLLLKGVSPDQFSVVSFGKEKLLPQYLGLDESSRAQNRRVEVIYEER